MAKGLRASRVKKNNSALRKKVFSPAENARNERLNAKLQALIAQPKPAREQMEVEEEPTSTTDAQASGAAAAEGTPSLSIPIPQSVLTVTPNHPLPTPPATPSTDASIPATPILDRAGQQQLAKEQLFFHLLGASSDIIGFDPNGDLRLAFSSSSTATDADADNAAMADADGAELARTNTRSRSNTEMKKAREAKLAKIASKRHRKVTNSMTFKKHPMKSKKGGKK